MSLFDSLGGKPPASAQMQNPQELMRKLQADPAAMLRQAGLSIPGGMRDPQQIVQHLMQTGQVPQNRLTQAIQMLGRMGGRR